MFAIRKTDNMYSATQEIENMNALAAKISITPKDQRSELIASWKQAAKLYNIAAGMQVLDVHFANWDAFKPKVATLRPGAVNV